MKTRALTVTALFLLGTSLAQAGGLDRTGLPIDIIFEDGNYAELSFSSTNTDVGGSGTGVVPATPLDGFLPVLGAGTGYDDVAGSFTNLGLGVKLDITDKISAAVFFEQPFGSDIKYNGDDTTELGGTTAIADSDMISAVLRYKFTDRFSAYGGVRVVRSGGDIDLRGRAYGPPSGVVAVAAPGAPFGTAGFNGYSVSLEDDTAVGFLIGAAYEIPDIALRVALTYNSAITHKFDTTERFGGVELGTSTTEVELPQSVALDFQTGVAPGTLVFGRIRWAEWSAFKIDPELFTEAANGGLVDLEDVTTYTLGVGRQFTEDFAGSFSVSYEEPDDDDLVSPLAPSNGLIAYNLGARYTMASGATISAGIRYTDIGDAQPETGTPDVARADFEDNSAVSVGFKLGFNF